MSSSVLSDCAYVSLNGAALVTKASSKAHIDSHPSIRTGIGIPKVDDRVWCSLDGITIFKRKSGGGDSNQLG
jgi:hypothetical protein